MVTDRSGEIMAPDLPEDAMGHSAPCFPVGRSGLRAIRHGTSVIVPSPFLCQWLSLQAGVLSSS